MENENLNQNGLDKKNPVHLNEEFKPNNNSKSVTTLNSLEKKQAAAALQDIADTTIPNKRTKTNPKKWIVPCIISLALICITWIVYNIVNQNYQDEKKRAMPETFAGTIMQYAKEGNWHVIYLSCEFSDTRFVSEQIFDETASQNGKISSYEVIGVIAEDKAKNQPSVVHVAINYTTDKNPNPQNITLALIRKTGNGRFDTWAVDCSNLLVPEVKIHTYSDIDLKFDGSSLQKSDLENNSNQNVNGYHKCTYVLKNVLKGTHSIEGASSDVDLKKTNFNVSSQTSQFDAYNVTVNLKASTLKINGSNINLVNSFARDTYQILKNLFQNAVERRNYSEIENWFTQGCSVSSSETSESIKEFYNGLVNSAKSNHMTSTELTDVSVKSPYFDSKSQDYLIIEVPVTFKMGSTYELYGANQKSKLLSIKTTIEYVKQGKDFLISHLNFEVEN